MALGALSLLAPAGLLVCLLAVIPVAVIARSTRQQRRLAAALGLEPAASRSWLPPAALSVGICLALGIAAAQPVLTTTSRQTARTSSEVVFVIDVSRSMAASSAPGAPTRLDQARDAAATLRAAVPAVPAGISGLTDRALPYVFPTLAAGVFAETLERSVTVESPPPQLVSTVATSFAPLARLVEDGFFSPRKEHRTCVVVTDGETRADSSDAASLAGERGCRLLVVRVGGSGDRIYRADGSIAPGYRPEGSAASAVETLARLADGEAFSGGELAAATAALKRSADVGATERIGVTRAAHALAPWLVGFALVGVAALVIRALRRPASGLQGLRRRRYHGATGF